MDLHELLSDVYLAVGAKKLEPLHANAVLILLLGLLQIGMADNIAELHFSTAESKRVLAKDVVEKIYRSQVMNAQATWLLFAEYATDLDLRPALDIYESIMQKHPSLPVVVRNDLLIRSVVFMFKEAPLAAYCWMAKNRVLDVQKFNLEKLGDCGPGMQQALILISIFEGVCDMLRRMHSEPSNETLAQLFERLPIAKKSDSLRSEIWDISSVADRARYLEGLKNSCPVLLLADRANPQRIKTYFAEVAKRRKALRAWTGTLASWPSAIGAGLILIADTHSLSFAEVLDRIELLHKLEAAGENFAPPARKPVYSDAQDDDSDTVTNNVRAELCRWGIPINARTLNTTYCNVRKTLIKLSNVYLLAERGGGAAFPPMLMENSAYTGVFMAAPEKLRKPLK